MVLKSGNLKVLELSGPVQACNGIALPLDRKFDGLQRQCEAVTLICCSYNMYSGHYIFRACFRLPDYVIKVYELKTLVLILRN